MTTDDVPDYYAELEIDPAAAQDQLPRLLDAAFRTWSSRASRAPDAAKRRVAEDKVALVGEARKELLDRAKRGAYDRRLAQAKQPRQQPRKTATPKAAPRPEPTQSGRDWVAQARALLEVNDEAGAVYELRQAVHHNDRDADAWRLLGVIHSNQGQHGDALQELQRALALHPGDALTHTLIAQVCAQTGQHSAAADWALKAVELAPADFDARLGAANSLYLAQRYDEALQNYEQALIGRPDDSVVKDQVGRIWALRAEGAMTLHPFHQRFVIPSAESAKHVIHCVDQALAVGVADGELISKLTRYRATALAAQSKTWRWRKSMAGVMAVCFVLMLTLPNLLSTLALFAFFGLPVAMGIKPRWRHTYNDLPVHTRPPLPQGRVR
ncbi:tetratricopeptide repeat protein [Streptomyces sp. A7024]|uniref:Tetratricopeptide repeat protein n=1 Tax=Streptomyces coryli TaxID=1128680 RepID=A0A6G4TTY1_9ACTN|nr:tetratricopeptide repeat protein [Streptomyces coryli]NGN63479.1 tetratricopeptide repeat protein [Streptomyces coryli]